MINSFDKFANVYAPDKVREHTAWINTKIDVSCLKSAKSIKIEEFNLLPLVSDINDIKDYRFAWYEKGLYLSEKDKSMLDDDEICFRYIPYNAFFNTDCIALFARNHENALCAVMLGKPIARSGDPIIWASDQVFEDECAYVVKYYKT